MEFKMFDTSFGLDGKTAVITGGERGLGFAIAKLFYAKGAKIALFDISDNVATAAAELGPDVIWFKVDVTKSPEIDAALEKVVENFGEINILCNIAGIGQTTPAEDVPEDELDKVIDVNFKGTFLMAQRVGRLMIAAQKGGKIVNMSSNAGNIGLAGHSVYGPTKAAVTNLTKVLAVEWGKYWINVNTISPTVTWSPMAEEFWGGAKGEEYLDRQPLHRFAQPEEVAACALFLASDASNMITGSNLYIDGGYAAL